MGSVVKIRVAGVGFHICGRLEFLDSPPTTKKQDKY